MPTQKLCIENIHRLWMNFFCDIPNSLKDNCKEQLGMSFEAIEESFKHFQSFTLTDLSKLKSALQHSFYPKDSKLNLFFAASTVPVTPFMEILYSLLMDTPILCRIPSNYNLDFYKFFEDKIPANLKSYVQFQHWSSEDIERTKKMVELAGCLIVHAKDETIQVIKQLALGKRLLGFGHKASFMVCDLKSSIKLDIDEFTKDIFAFNQMGCMSPQVIYALNVSESDLENFAKELAQQLQKLNFQVSPASAFQKRSSIEKAIMSGSRVLGSSVIISTGKTFEYSCGGGLIHLQALDKLTDLQESTQKLKGRVSCIGNNLQISQKQSLNELFPNVRLCEIGKMQLPEISWIQAPTIIV